MVSQFLDLPGLSTFWEGCKATFANKTGNDHTHQIKHIIDAYPVGSIYISTIATNPSELFGFGTWEQIKGRFLFAADDTYAAGSTGGEAEHILTNEEMPEHKHAVITGSHPVSQNSDRYAESVWGFYDQNLIRKSATKVLFVM